MIKKIIYLLLFVASPNTFAQPIVIEQIEIEGVYSIPADEIESSIETVPGDVLDKSIVVRSLKNLQNLYYIKGFQNVHIQSELKKIKDEKNKIQTVLIYRINEGFPTRVAGVRIVFEDVANTKFEKEKNKLEGKIFEKIDIHPGDVMSQSRISLSRRAIESYLAEEEYIGSQASDVRIVSTDLSEVEKKEFDSKYSHYSRLVNLEFRVYPGQKVTFGFRGNDFFERNELMDLIEEQRAVGFGKDYVHSIEERILNAYIFSGFTHVQIKSKTFEQPEIQQRHVTFEITEGPRVQIEEIEFEGNTIFDSEILLDHFYENASVKLKNNIYVEKEVDQSIERLAQWLQSKGYLSSRIVSVSRTFVYSDKRKVRLLIYLNEGEQTILNSLNFEGAGYFNRKTLIEMLGIKEQDPLDLFAFADGLEVIKKNYRNHGFLSVQIDQSDEARVVRYTDQNRTADIFVKVIEGPRYFVNKITIHGLQSTMPHVVGREFKFAEEHVLEETQIFETESNLRRLGLFSSIQIELRDSPLREGFKDIHLFLQEGTPGKVGGGMGVRNDLGIRVFGESSYSNLWARNHTWFFNANANRRFEEFCREGSCFAEYQLKMGYVWPWFVVDEMTFNPILTQERRRFKEFDASTAAVTATIDKKLLKYVNLYGAFTYSFEQTTQFNAVFEEDRQRLLIGSIIPSLRLDLRDNPLMPSKGFYSVLSHEIASSNFGSQTDPFPIGYTKTQFRADYTVPVARRVSWYFSFRTGFQRNTVDPFSSDGSRDRRIAIPLIKQFSLGGVNSLRGFKPQELNLQDVAIQGTASYVNYRTQLDFPLSGDLRIGPFLDAGNLLLDQYSFGKLRYGTGIGLHYSTPVGPVNFDWGFKIDPRPGEDPSQFYFSLGVI